MDVCEKHWLDYVQAFGTIALGVGVWWVYWQQWKTQKKQLAATQLEKYEKAYYLLETLLILVDLDDIKGELRNLSQLKLISLAPAVQTFIREVENTVHLLHRLDKETPADNEQAKKLRNDKREPLIKKLGESYSQLDNIFSPYLNISP